MRQMLASLEGSGADLPVSLALLGGRELELDEDEVRASLRRAEFVLAAGGDPRRELDPDGRAVSTLMADLDSEEARASLAAGLERLAADAAGLPEVAATLAQLLDDGDLAWRAYACALLAEALLPEELGAE